MSKNLERLQQENQGVKIQALSVYMINGVLHVSRDFICKILPTTTQSISNWEKKGLQISVLSRPKLKLYDFEYLKAWHRENIDQGQAQKRGKHKVIDINGDEDTTPSYLDGLDDEVLDIEGKIKQANKVLQIKSTSSDEADRVLKIMNALIKSIEVGKQSKELIPKKDVEKIILEMIGITIGGYKNDIKILPKDCVGRTEKEIKDILEKNFRGNIENFQKLLKTEADAHIYDVIHTAQELILWGVKVSEVIGAIKALKVEG